MIKSDQIPSRLRLLLVVYVIAAFPQGVIGGNLQIFIPYNEPQYCLFLSKVTGRIATFAIMPQAVAIESAGPRALELNHYSDAQRDGVLEAMKSASNRYFDGILAIRTKFNSQEHCWIINTAKRKSDLPFTATFTCSAQLLPNTMRGLAAGVQKKGVPETGGIQYNRRFYPISSLTSLGFFPRSCQVLAPKIEPKIKLDYNAIADITLPNLNPSVAAMPPLPPEEPVITQDDFNMLSAVLLGDDNTANLTEQVTAPTLDTDCEHSVVSEDLDREIAELFKDELEQCSRWQP